MIHVLAGLGVVILLAVVLLTDAGEIRRRLRQAGHLLTEAGPRLVSACLDVMARQRGFVIPASHPSARCRCDACTADLDPVAFACWEHEFHGRRAS